MAKMFTIGEISKACDVPASTLRYYERIGLLRPDDRTVGNYRLYGPPSLERVQFIRAAQATGFRLDDVTTLLELRDGSAGACKEVEHLIVEHLADLEKRMKDLRRVRGVLKASLKLCQQAEERDHCEVIDRLGTRQRRRKR